MSWSRRNGGVKDAFHRCLPARRHPTGKKVVSLAVREPSRPAPRVPCDSDAVHHLHCVVRSPGGAGRSCSWCSPLLSPASRSVRRARLGARRSPCRPPRPRRRRPPPVGLRRARAPPGTENSRSRRSRMQSRTRRPARSAPRSSSRADSTAPRHRLLASARSATARCTRFPTCRRRSTTPPARSSTGQLFVFGGGDGYRQLDGITRIDADGAVSAAGTLPAPSSDAARGHDQRHRLCSRRVHRLGLARHDRGVLAGGRCARRRPPSDGVAIRGRGRRGREAARRRRDHAVVGSDDRRVRVRSDDERRDEDRRPRAARYARVGGRYRS